MSTSSIGITAWSMASALGVGNAVHSEALTQGRSGLRPSDFDGVDFDCHIGRVAGIEDIAIPNEHRLWDNRATRLCLSALQSDGFSDAVIAARDRVGAERLGVIVGTSTSGVEAAERAYRSRTDRRGALPGAYSLKHSNDHHAIAGFLQAALGLCGPSWTISTACSSSAKALIDAYQLVGSGLCDAVLVCGVDSLCLTSLYGFEALELVSRAPCRPCDAARDGLSIGEGAACLLVERNAQAPYRMAGYGETSDGVHMSTPPEDGAGAAKAMQDALFRARLDPSDIGFVKLHGTATPANDRAEGAAVSHVFGAGQKAGSLKGMLGHTLGAAGGLEIAMMLLAFELGLCPGNVGMTRQDTAIDCDVSAAPRPLLGPHIVANAFGFGGNNCSVVLSKTP